MSLKEQLLAAELGLTEADFDTHESDLYVLAKPGVMEAIRRLSPISRPEHFQSNPKCDWKGATAIDIPFANQEFWPHN